MVAFANTPRPSNPGGGAELADPRYIVFQEREDGPFSTRTVSRSLTAPQIEAELGLRVNWYGCDKACSPAQAVAEAKAGGYKFRSLKEMDGLKNKAVHLGDQAAAHIAELRNEIK